MGLAASRRAHAGAFTERGSGQGSLLRGRSPARPSAVGVFGVEVAMNPKPVRRHRGKRRARNVSERRAAASVKGEGKEEEGRASEHIEWNPRIN